MTPAGPGFPAFLGAWRVSRRVLDRMRGSLYRFDGKAVLTPDGFEEDGRMWIDGRAFTAARRYRLEAREGALVVRFPAGNLFFELDFSGPGRIRHLCGRDIYDGRLVARSADLWAESWRVRGPDKDYTSLAIYRRGPRGDAVQA